MWFSFAIGDIIQFRRALVNVETKLVTALVAYKIDANAERSCRIGFLPDHLLRFHYGYFENSFAKILWFMKDHENLSYRRMDHQNYGVAKCLYLGKDVTSINQ